MSNVGIAGSTSATGVALDLGRIFHYTDYQWGVTDSIQEERVAQTLYAPIVSLFRRTALYFLVYHRTGLTFGNTTSLIHRLCCKYPKGKSNLSTHGDIVDREAESEAGGRDSNPFLHFLFSKVIRLGIHSRLGMQVRFG